MIVVIPTYLNYAGLAATLTMLADQTVLPEKVVVINTSPDKKASEITKMFSYNLNIKLIEENPCSIYRAWNYGLKEGNKNTKLFWIINDDTLFPRQAIEILNEVHMNNKEALCLCPDTPSREFHADTLDPHFGFSFNCTIAVDNIKPTNWMSGFSFCLTRHCVDQIGLFDEKFDVWYGDTAYEKQILSRGNILKIGGFKVYHFGGKSYEYQSDEVKARIDKDRLYYEKLISNMKGAGAVARQS